MNRLTNTLEDLKNKSKKALVAYLVAGDPDIETTLELMTVLVESGVDIIEIGVPFTDPIAEGPIIQKAFCIIGPSAIGSVKGTPISIISTPDSTRTVINSRVVSMSGSPATRYATRAFLLLFFKSSKVLVSLFKSLFHQYLQQC